MQIILRAYTTAEEMARFIFQRLKYDEKLPISAIRLWETPTSFCEYGEWTQWKNKIC